MRFHAALIAPLALLLAAAMPATGAEPASAGAVAPSLPPGEMAAVVVPDLRSLLAHVEAVANAVQPGSVPAGSLAAKLGDSLGDPTLGLIGPGPLVAVVLPGMPLPKSALMVPSSKPQDLVAAVQAHGGVAQVVGALVAIARDEDSLSAASAEAYQALAAHPPAADVRLLVSPKLIAGTYGMFLQMMMGNLNPGRQAHAGGMDTAQLMKVMRIEVAALLRLMGDTEAVQDDISLKGGDIEVSATTVAAAGSGLAKALVAPVGDPAALARARGRVYDGAAIMRWAGNLPCPQLYAYAKDVLAAIPEAKAMIPAGCFTAMDQLAAVPCDGFSSAFGADDKGEAMFSTVYAMRDLEACKSGLRTCMQAISDASSASNGFFGGLETAAFQKDATTLVLTPPLAGTPPIDKVNADLLTLAVSPELKKQTPMPMPEKFWFAFADGLFLNSSDVVTLTRMLQNPHAPAPMAAEAAFPADHDGCCDMDLVALVSMQAGAVATLRQQHGAAAPGAAPAPAVAIKPSGKPPMCMAWSTHDGQLVVRTRLSIATITACVEAVKSTMGGMLGLPPGQAAPQQF